LGELRKRFDILVYDKAHKPWMMIECKEPDVSLGEAVLQQVLRYGISVPVPYLVITNGGTTIGWKKEGPKLVMVKELPGMETL
jgi:type I site-specific restriction endonuclease